MSQFFDAFISYGRADSKILATKVYHMLTAQGLKVWFDRQDIPPGVDWQHQIDDGIERTHNFIFIISPHSVKSLYCYKEIELAVSYNKRIIPLLHVNSEEFRGQMHPIIRKVNWIFFQEQIDNFKESFIKLIQTINLHSDYVKQHTKLLVKALEWSKNNQKNKDLLIGEERKKAQAWLATKFPDEQMPCVPTDLHCKFICESIKNANNLMTQVFLAASEQDKDVKEKIGKSLMRKGITIWTDKTDIKTGVEFLSQINRGVEGADNFVYLISPDALQSSYCQQELARALEYNKRIIPLLIKPTLLIKPNNLDEFPLEILSLQFIDLTGYEDEFKYREGVEKLLKELNEEPSYYEYHKILLVKALKWQEQNKNPSLLLRGYNLEHMSAWLKVAKERSDRPPLALHEKFIAESLNHPKEESLEVFISYSRADSDFARKLNDALQELGKTTWFDQESIAVGVDFQQEIYRGIESCDNFIFVISPRSVNSPYCADEVEYAKKLNKRFITILHAEVSPEKLHPVLAKIQWIDFKGHGGDFSANFNELVRTLDTDRDYVRSHSKWHHKAREWKQKDRSEDLLLRGRELTIAENWLLDAQQDRKQPPATSLQKEFIDASVAWREGQLRQEKQLRNRQLMATSIASVIFAGFAIFAGYQWKEANKQAQKAFARQLASTSEWIRSQYPDLHETSALLAVESMKRFQELGDLSLQADRTLRNSLELLPISHARINHQDWVNAVAFSSDGNYLATGSRDKIARIIEVKSGKEIARVTHQDSVNAVAFSADGKYLATGSNDNTARIIEVKSSKEIARINHQDWVNAVAFSADGNYLATGSRDKIAHIIEVKSRKEIARINHQGSVNAVAFNPDGNYLATGSDDSTARIIEVKSGEELARINHQDWVKTVAFSADGKYLATGSNDKTARIIEVKSGKKIARITHKDWVNAVAFSADSSYLATGSNDKTARIIEVKSGKELARITHQDWVNAVAFSADGKYLATGSDDRTARISEVKSGKEIARITHQEEVRAEVFSRDGKYLATGSGDNTAQLHELSPRALIARACSRLKRNLRVDEWQSFIKEPLSKYHLTCSDYPVHPSFLEEGKRLAETNELKAAVIIFRRLQKLDPDIDLNPDTKSIDKDPLAVSQKWAAPVKEDAKIAKHKQPEETSAEINQQVELKSDKGVDYTQLRNYLEAGNWKKADEETYTVMLQAVKAENKSNLTKESLKNFSCNDLNTINSLWQNYSEGRFGFSIQNKIYQSLAKSPNALGNKVGWSKRDIWMSYDFLWERFNQNVPEGHLPARVFRRMEQGKDFWSLHIRIVGILDRTNSCNL